MSAAVRVNEILQDSDLDYEDPALQIFALHGGMESREDYLKTSIVDQSERHKEPRYYLNHVADVARREVIKQPFDRYQSPAAFARVEQLDGTMGYSRKKFGIAKMPCLYLDLDFHEVPELKDYSPEKMVEKVDQRCDDFDIDSPNFIVFSGRGLQLYWIHKPLRFGEKNREKLIEVWKKLQDILLDIFLELGADPRCKDIVKILRLVGSKSSRTGKTVRIMRIDSALLDGTPRKPFWRLLERAKDSLEKNAHKIDYVKCARILKGKKMNSDAHIAQMNAVMFDQVQFDEHEAELFLTVEKVNSIAKRGYRSTPISESFNVTKVVELHNYRNFSSYANGASSNGKINAARARLKDIFKLIDARHGEKIPKGLRNQYFFAMACCLAFLATPKALEAEMIRLGWVLTEDWSDENTMNSIYSVLERAKEAESGKARDFNGDKNSDPRYFHKSANLASFLGVSRDEMISYNLRGLVDYDIREENKKRDNNLINARKRKCKSKRDEINARRKENRANSRRISKAHKNREAKILKVFDLHQEGLNNTQIAKKVDISRKTVGAYLKAAPALVEERNKEANKVVHLTVSSSVKRRLIKRKIFDELEHHQERVDDDEFFLDNVYLLSGARRIDIAFFSYEEPALQEYRLLSANECPF